MTPTPTLTLTLHEYINLACGYRDSANIDVGRAKEILALQDHGLYCHIQMPGDEPGNYDVRIPKLWRIEDWRTSMEKWKKDKERSGKEREVSCMARELSIEIAKKLLKEGLCTEEQEAMILARRIVDKRSEKLAATFGIDLKELIEKWEKLNV